MTARELVQTGSDIIDELWSQRCCMIAEGSKSI